MAELSEDRAHLRMWTIYDHPSDYPNGYVVRAMTIRPPAEGGPVHDEIGHGYPTLEAARAGLPPGLVRMAPAPEDDPVILETWL